MARIKEGQSQINIVTTEETHALAKEQSKKLFGKENVAAYIELIVRLDAASGLINKLLDNVKCLDCKHYRKTKTSHRCDVIGDGISEKDVYHGFDENCYCPNFIKKG